MKRWRWEIAAGPGDFLPLLVGFVLLALTVPSFLMLLKLHGLFLSLVIPLKPQ